MIPQHPNKLSQRIKGVKSNLDGLGISYEFNRARSLITLPSKEKVDYSTMAQDGVEPSTSPI